MIFSWFDIRTLDDAAYHAAFSLLDSKRKKAVNNLAAEDDRKRTVVGEMLIRNELGKLMNGAPESFTICRDDENKPYSNDCPYQFSISHSGPFVACVVDSKPIGVDVEVMRGAKEKFIARVCTEAEQKYIRYGDAGCFTRFWECWTAKEALFKLTGKGPLLSLSFLDLPSGVSTVHLIRDNCSITIAQYL